MDIVLIVAGIFALLVVVTLAKAVRIVPQAEVQVIERLGRFHRVLNGGLNVIVPFVDQVRQTFSTQEQVIDIPSQQVITADNVQITIDGVVFLRINDAKLATYEINDLKHAIAQLAQTTLRSEIGKMELDNTLSSREEMNAALLMALDNASGGWGAKVTRVEISDISVPDNVQRAMELQLQATRERRAIEQKAEAEKNSTIAKAEGDKERAYREAEALERTAEARKKEQVLLAEAAKTEEVLKAEGQKQAIELVAAGLRDNPDAGEYLLTQGRIAAWAGIAASDSQNKVVVPYEVSELIGSLATVKDFLANPGKRPENGQ
ncbi:SPFH domain-containing protein [Marinobacter sp. C2H3]|uniref:SPFH domain-containing protein n=1 Tax=Marinobacter sp. C2H3 TaxID=3119003 RepID=UPI00300F11AE